ncbi:2-polyprenyl-6-methoxyphenol hydroxylase-like FAD-dependent oxidoreductase [Filimonas zeae]|uniref:FAD-binding monooxygenase n=1 Tax=Filimonas zeae TaxID=1737353 RepID=A0A917J0W1_9BACT|nr:FAD-dependent monooxygenase [Filimonas zeae]MDR6341350.1 2-polyprenyl-6-methoxyphenol hydroxylase-like FAD-dependent oxidoreductase [Filimonas zeae]GGH76231.1 FAD-binding monooxygenase [Filimonas zeae]
MKKAKKILVSGGSIAGLTLAYWLNRYGFEVTVIEKSDGLRLGGQNIDVKGPAWAIIQKMELGQEIESATTTEVGIRFVNTKNAVVAEFPKDNAISMTQEIEILRGDMVNILYHKIKDSITVYFGDQINSIHELEDSVEVTYNKRGKETFDLVLIAEGIGSTTRQQVFGREIKFDYLGLYSAYLTIEKAPTDSRWARWCNAIGAIVFLVRPDNHGTTRLCIFFRSPELGYEKLPIAEQKKLLIQKIQDVGWEAPRFVKELEQTTDLYFERVSQVKAPHWHKGRIAMVGDAAYCPTPITGKGTDLAVTGAYILAGELGQHKDYNHAFGAYENIMRPYVNKTQKRPPGVPRLVYPESRFGVAVINAIFSLAGSRFAKFITNLFSKKKAQPKEEIQLPEYQDA